MYYVLKDDFDERYVYVSKQPDVKNWVKINKGVSLLDEWPDGVKLQHSKSAPEGVLLTDKITNNRGWLSVGEKFTSGYKYFTVSRNMSYNEDIMKFYYGFVAAKW